MTLLETVIYFLALIVSLSLHEFSHALVADIQGDHTARRMGRLTLNPLAHVHPIGTLLVPLLALLLRWPLIGWAKPVPHNPYNLKWGRRGSILVALAGPASNFLSALLFLLMLRLAVSFAGLTPDNLLTVFLVSLAQVNIFLGIFNLLPVPPLDGSHLLEYLLAAPRHRQTLLFLRRHGMTILYLIIIAEFISPRPIIGSLFWGVAGGFFWLFGFA